MSMSTFLSASILSAGLLGSSAAFAEEPPVAAALAAPLDLRAAVRAVQPAHVLVTVSQRGVLGAPAKSRTSGILLNQQGFVLTMSDVLNHAEEIEVDLFEGEPQLAALIARNPAENVGLIKIAPLDQTGLTLPALEWERAPELGEPVFALGNPFNLGRSLAVGHVTGLDRHIMSGAAEIEGLIQVSIPVNAGDQGGPVADADGNVVAMLHSTYGVHPALGAATGSGISFALPIARVRPWVETLVDKYEAGEIAATTQEPSRPWLGLRALEIREAAFRDQLRLSQGGGVLVDDVFASSPAQRAGLQPHDILVTWDNQTIQGLQHLGTLLRSTTVSNKVVFGVIRGGERVTVTLIVGGHE